MFCPKCRGDIPYGASKCQNCGFSPEDDTVIIDTPRPAGFIVKFPRARFGGCFTQIIGFLILFFGPKDTPELFNPIVGLFLILAGGFTIYGHSCSVCGGKLGSGREISCPSCGADLR